MAITIPRSVRLLHVSDLHLPVDHINGCKIVDELWERLWRNTATDKGIGNLADVCVVTGDVSPNSPNKKVFQALRSELDRRFPCDSPFVKFRILRPPAVNEDGASTERTTSSVDGLHPPKRTHTRWIVVPGNHDRKTWGNFSIDERTFEQTFDEWNLPAWSPEAALILIPIDSNPKKKSRSKITFAMDLARGCVSAEELDRLGSVRELVEADIIQFWLADLAADSFRNLKTIAPRLKSAFSPEELEALQNLEAAEHLPHVHEKTARLITKLFMTKAAKCVLMHHHPVGVADTENLGPTHQDVYLMLTNAGDFLKRARANHVSLICHGHKHVPHRLVISLPSEDAEPMTVVGAGSTTKKGTHNSATANVISINENGEVSVSLHKAGQERWEAAKEIVTRPWSQIKESLAKCATRESRITVRSAQADIELMSTGDATVIWHLKGLSVDPRAWPSNSPYKMLIPIEGWFDTHARTPEVIFAGGPSGTDVRIIPSKRASADYSSRPGAIQITTPNKEIGELSIRGRQIGYCAFANNGWQFRGLYGNDEMRESFTWTSAIPVTDRLTVSVACSTQETSIFDPQSYRITVTDFLGVSNPSEMSETFYSEAPDHRRVTMTCQRPVWGSSYELTWKWRRQGRVEWVANPKSEAKRKKIDDELRRIAAGTRRPNQLALCRTLKAAFSTSVEATLFAIPSPVSGQKTVMSQLGWNDAVEERELHAIDLPFGVGVAGRAAWLRSTVVWTEGVTDDSTPDQRPADDVWSDWYVRCAGSTHHKCIIAIPVGGRKSPLGVLSLAADDVDALPENLQNWVRGTLNKRQCNVVDECSPLKGTIKEIDRLLSNW